MAQWLTRLRVSQGVMSSNPVYAHLMRPNKVETCRVLTGSDGWYRCRFATSSKNSLI